MKKRIVMLLSVVALLVGMLAMSVGPGFAAPGGNAANAAKCEEGGYLDYTDANGNPFKNEGQCTRYAARGGQLVPVPVLTPDITITYQGFDTGTISGTGFTPNSQITYTVTYSPSGLTYTGNDVFTDAMGAFTLGDDFAFCFNDTNTSIQVTATDSEKVSATESLALSCGGT